MKERAREYLTREEINERIAYIEGSDDYYISENGNVYKYFKDSNEYFKKKNRLNKNCGYIYNSYITREDKKRQGFRVHKMVALYFVDNPNPEKFIIVGHKDDNKTNNNYQNLYWTTNQENIKSAINNGLLTYKTGEDSEFSQPIKVVDLENNLVAVYGSLGEAKRNIENIKLSYLSKTVREEGNDYKPRGKKYKYFKISKEDYSQTPQEYKGKRLIENVPASKKPIIFKAVNLKTGEEIISDNQKQFGKEHNLNQAKISHAIKNGGEVGNWKFCFIEKIEYAEGSCYNNLMETIPEITVKNIKTQEIKTFRTRKELKDFFNLDGHDIKQYFHRGIKILSEWEVIDC